MRKAFLLVGLLAAALVAGGFLFMRRGSSPEAKYRWVKVDRGAVTATVTATGTLSAVTTVSVGSQVSGIIAKLYADFNSVVKKGQLLAELDPTPFQQTVDQQRANLEKAKVELRNAEVSLTRAKNLFKQDLEAQSDLDAAQTARDAAAAAVEQAAAALKQAETNLSYTKIRSPIDGVVVTRAYDLGQTVAASFQAPTLFTIAQDLTKMQVLTNIDEADVGQIRMGQVANFTVDAFPDTAFKASVSQIRLSAQIVQNVVTYPVMLDVPNPDLKLKPGMTANVVIPVDTRQGVLRVPNAALRFRPDAADLLTSAPGQGEKAPTSKTAAGTPASSPAGPPAGTTAGRGPGAAPAGPGAGPGGSRPASSRAGTVYMEVPGTKGKLKAVRVKTLITDGNYTAVDSSELTEGDEIAVGLATAKAGTPGGPGAGRRPF
ncbi:MAG: efflux RND transporter periplasmic adaptor subunit [Acidithiobacillales bacterium]